MFYLIKFSKSIQETRQKQHKWIKFISKNVWLVRLKLSCFVFFFVRLNLYFILFKKKIKSILKKLISKLCSLKNTKHAKTNGGYVAHSKFVLVMKNNNKL